MRLFEHLSDDEKKEYQKWARDNYKPFTPIQGIWHPVVQQECASINLEKSENLSNVGEILCL